jgi:hypothetical protein
MAQHKMFGVEGITNTRHFSDLRLEESVEDNTRVSRNKRPRTTGSRPSLSILSEAPLRRTVTPEIVIPGHTESPRKLRGVRSVSFSDSHETYSQHPLPVEEVDETCRWYSLQDYAHFRMNVQKEVLHLANLCRQDSLGKVDFSEQTVVGIEKYCCSADERYTAKSNKAMLVRAVLDTQAAQRATGMKDQETIRNMSERLTQANIEEAVQRANAFR